MSLTDDLSPSKSSKAPKRGDKGPDSLAGVALANKATIKFVKSFNSLKSDTFKPFHKNQLTTRASLVTEDKVGENVNFNDPKDQKLVADILALRPQRRMEDEITVLKKAFRDVDFFKKVENEMDEASFTAIFQALRLEYFRAGQKVFSHGDIGKTFYIIIKGSVYILLKSEGVVHSDEIQELPISLILQNNELFKHKEALGTFLKSDASQDAKREMVEKCYPGFWIVQEKLKGDSFGDLALSKNSNRLRTATVVCSDDTVFGILSFNDYQSILGALQEKKFTENIQCLSNVNIFKHWKHNQISSLLMSAEEVKLTRNQVIFKEGDAPKLLYFIKQGEVEKLEKLRKIIDMDNKDDNLEELGPSLMNKQTAAKSKGWKKQEAMRLGILTKGDYFGEGEVITVKQREYSAIVYSSEVLLISIPRDKFLGFVKDKTSLQSFETHVKSKKQWRDNLIKKMVSLRSDKSASPTSTQNVQSSPKITVVKRSTIIMTEGPIDNPMKRASVYRNALEERSGSLVLEDRFDLHSPTVSARGSRIIVGFTGSIPGSPQGKLLDDSPTIKMKKDKPARLMSTGFSFTQMKMTSDKSPLYERQKEKIERKLQQDRQELNLQLNLHKVKSFENDEASKSATIPVKSKPSQTTRASVKIPTSNASSRGSLPTLENFDSSPVSTKTARESIVRSSLIMADPMAKMYKQLGLDKIYSEKDVRLVSLDGRVCGPIQSLSSLPGVLPEFNKASLKEKSIRPGSVHNIHVKMPGTSTVR